MNGQEIVASKPKTCETNRTPESGSVPVRADVPVEVVGEIVHDVRNVLAIINSALGMAEQKNDARDILRLVSGARDCVRQGVELTTRLLAVSVSGSANPQLMDARALLRRLEGVFEWEEGSVQVLVKIAPDAPECEVDAVQFNAAILNLVINAREASPDGGTVGVCADRYVPLDESLNRIVTETYLRVRIKDDGCGVAPEIVPRLFEPHFSTKGGEGRGLGLAQVGTFAKHVGANLNVISERGYGTTVELLIPAARSAG